MTKRELQAADYAAEMNENDILSTCKSNELFPDLNVPEVVANTFAAQRRCLEAAGIEIAKLRHEVERLKKV
jgi:hypothetical protein